MSRTGLTIPNNKKTHLHLTPKQRTFAEVYVASYPNITKKEAAKKAGYSEPTCEKWGSLLTNPEKYPHVVSFIEEMREKGVAHFKDYLRHLKRLDSLSKKAEDKGQMAAATNAEFRLGQAAGFYIDRKEIKTQNLSAMNKEDLIKSIKELKDELGETKIIEISAEAEVVENESAADK
tara:strand:+ start:151 stop:681 length:531 start_codon:yes stop_codon:yes gene_type:complete